MTAPGDRTGEQLAANRRLWDERVDVHYRSAFYDVDSFRTGGSRISQFELDEIGEVANRDLLHLQCHFGLDTLSFARLGARVTGVDFSAPAVERARELAAELGLAATFVRSDVFELPGTLSGDFDIVYTSHGVLGWLPDLRRWAEVIAHFLRPGGVFYMAEIHPVAQALDDAEEATEPRLRYPYFSLPAALEFPVAGSYAEPTATFAEPTEYTWTHDLGEIVTSIAGAGLRIDLLHEHPFNAWRLPFLVLRDGQWRLPTDTKGELPLSFSLKAIKPLG